MNKPDSRPEADAAWDALLRQLPSQSRAQPRPFFYGRVQARLAAETSTEKLRVPGWLRRPAFAALLAALVLSLSGDGATTGAASRTGMQAPRLLPR
ncbi:hypothetical protein ACFST9_06405 [Hymenobacter monticola]|uniref:Uncharacterized protein n=1 Tax=Hymenobacter monticola TaxID=1705399 RepID=A0ABY4BAR1_9BACT|nr:hypothetical protein [Hymenobacter monticola]UOE36247.1 hypothetical protein MTP16_11530 [Hymenobacter monticola]